MLAAILVLGCLPLIAVIAIAIRIDSAGPALFRQVRIGKDGKSFTIIKFRTLQTTAPKFAPKVSIEDPLVTRVGRILRRSGLDELPQLWNVLRGEMALIGPRPEQIELIHLYEPWQQRRHMIKPGITGWWQIHHRDGAPLHQNVDKDLYYIRHQGPWIDLLIVVATCRIVLAALTASARPGQAQSLLSAVDAALPKGDTP